MSGILVTLIIGTLMAALDSSIVNVSIPAMMNTLNAEIDGISWVISAYMIGFAVVMPLTQWLKERLGYYRLYSLSLLVFTVGSFLCGIARSLELLVLARVIQAFGGGLLTPTAMAILATLYPPDRRGRVIGLWGLGVVVGPALGPTVGGVLTEHFGWPAIFLVNLPIGLAGLWMSRRYLRPLAFPRLPSVRFDFGGFFLFCLVLVSLLYGITRLEEDGIGSPVVLGCFAVAILTFPWFLRIQSLIDLELFRSRGFVACLLVTFSRSMALFGGIFLLPLLLQNLLHYSETQAGLLMLPGGALVAILMPFAGRWADRRGARGISLAGLGLLGISMIGFSLLTYRDGVPWILVSMCLRGLGLGLLVTPISVATVNAVAESQVAMATSLSSLVQQVGGALGVAGVSVLHESLSHGSEAFALRTCFAVIAGLVALALVPGLLVPRGQPHGEVAAEGMVEPLG